MTRTAVYRFFDWNHELIYVGITDHLGYRFRQHERSSPWWRMAETVEVVWCDSRAEASRIEQEAISREWPIFNVAGHPNQDHCGRIDDYIVSMGFDRP